MMALGRIVVLRYIASPVLHIIVLTFMHLKCIIRQDDTRRESCNRNISIPDTSVSALLMRSYFYIFTEYKVP